MPNKGQEMLPDRSKPETMGREPSVDEKKEDVRRLDSYVRDLDRLLAGLENLNCSKTRKRLLKAALRMRQKFQADAQLIMKEIRDEINAAKGNTGKVDGHFRGGRSNQKGGPKF
jgi:hypothetical protein